VTTVIYDKEKQKVPIKIWAPENEIETQAIAQLKNIASLPFVFKHVAAMPDVHLGLGATVGSVIATKGAVIPAAVGVDIGCGMMAVQIEANLDLVKEKVKEIRHSIERSIPVGFGQNKHCTDAALSWYGWESWGDLHAPSLTRSGSLELRAKAMNQMGSLGGGNHFIELCEDTEGGFWVMLHSGSRGVGNQVANVHINHAKGEMKKLFIDLSDPDLAYYVEGTKEYDNYISDLHWCQEYAYHNRQVMMGRVLKDLRHALKVDSLNVLRSVNCHHNYASKENHYGENVLVTRKGAVRARSGDMGIIPGSMGTRSYIVEGLGNSESFHSCSHGAGRKMSRTKAKANFTIADLEAQTVGVECRKDSGVLDEIPGAYKDIDKVMENQKDLVKVVAQLKQFMCIKG
jgi:tRNA-splicing ligase RtcB